MEMNLDIWLVRRPEYRRSRYRVVMSLRDAGHAGGWAGSSGLLRTPHHAIPLLTTCISLITYAMAPSWSRNISIPHHHWLAEEEVKQNVG
jgi:hypothetical protein